MVQEICRDIKKLDHAKKHLTHTITALRRFAMLVTAVGAHGALEIRNQNSSRIFKMETHERHALVCACLRSSTQSLGSKKGREIYLNGRNFPRSWGHCGYN